MLFAVVWYTAVDWRQQWLSGRYDVEDTMNCCFTARGRKKRNNQRHQLLCNAHVWPGIRVVKCYRHKFYLFPQFINAANLRLFSGRRSFSPRRTATLVLSLWMFAQQTIVFITLQLVIYLCFYRFPTLRRLSRSHTPNYLSMTMHWWCSHAVNCNWERVSLK